MNHSNKQPYPHEGQNVIVRNRRALVRAVKESPFHGTEALHEVFVEYIDGWMYPTTDFILWELEHGTQIVANLAMPRIGNQDLQMDHPDRVRAFLYASQWSAVNQLAAEQEQEVDKVRLISPWQSAVQVEDYQLFPVLKAMLMPRISMLLADDVGLGKTIEAGLILSELYARRRIRRVLIVCPAALQLQWRDEMHEKFHLDFTIVDREATSRLQRELGVDSNPWLSYPRIITSMDYLRQGDICESFLAATNKLAGRFEDILPWQMLVVDEAHNLAPSKYGDDSDRCNMLRRISPWFEHRLFLSATPHNGYTLSFTGLLELLDPVRFQQKPTLNEEDHKQIAAVMVRRLKSDLNEEGERKRFADREVEGMNVSLYEPERALFAALQSYRHALHQLLKNQHNKREQHLGEFLIKLLTKRLLSSSYAFARTWWQHVEGLALYEQDLQIMEHTVNRAEMGMNDDQERSQREEDAIKQTGAWLSRYAGQLHEEHQMVSACLTNLGWSAEMFEAPSLQTITLPPDTRWDCLKQRIDEKLRDGQNWRKSERVIIFTEYKHTLDYLLERFRREQFQEHVVECLYGGVSSRVRERIKDAFNDPNSSLRILIGTDTVSEGISLQTTCRYVIHQDIPWNPMRMEQRNGRVDRHGQERKVWAYHFTSQEKDDLEFMAAVVDKVKQARSDLGSVGQVIDRSLEQYFTHGDLSKEAFDERIETARKETKEREDLRMADRGRKSPQDLQGEIRLTSALAKLRLDATEHLLELSPENVARVLQQAALNQGGSLKKEVEKGNSGEPPKIVYTFDIVPPTWRKLIKERLERSRQTDSGRPKMVFDPAYFEKTDEVTGILTFKPRTDRELIRLAHPIMQKGIHALRRRMWEKLDDHKDLSRWTVLGYNLPHGVEKVLLIHLFLEVTNQFREMAHQQVFSYAFQVRGDILNPYPLDLTAALQGRFLLSDAQLRRSNVPELQDLWLYHDPLLRTFIAEKRNEFTNEFTHRMQHRREQETQFEEQALTERLRELDRMKEPREVRRLKRENERLEKIIVKAEQPSLFSEIQEEWAQAATQAEEQREANNWQMHVANYVEDMKQLVQKEQQRLLTKVLPKRYALATVDLQPLTVEYIVRASREEIA